MFNNVIHVEKLKKKVCYNIYIIKKNVDRSIIHNMIFILCEQYLLTHMNFLFFSLKYRLFFLSMQAVAINLDQGTCS